MSSPPEPDPRIFFAAERTLLAWIRTGLALMGLGFVVARFGMLSVSSPRSTERLARRGFPIWSACHWSDSASW